MGRGVPDVGLGVISLENDSSREQSGQRASDIWGMVRMVLWGLLRNLHSRPRGPAVPRSTEPALCTSTNAPASGVPTVLFPHWALFLLEARSSHCSHPACQDFPLCWGHWWALCRLEPASNTCSLAADLAPRPLRPPGPGKTTTPRGLWDVHKSPV